MNINNLSGNINQIEKTQTLINKMPVAYKPLAKFISLQEAESGLSHIRFIQDTTTNWVPKAILSRSKADLTESTFLEFAESALVYYGPGLVGEKFFRKIYSKNMPEKLKDLISKPLAELEKNKNLNAEELKKLKSTKAAIALACLCIPFTELSLNYVKNLLTLKLFKQADFNNIANLNKTKQEDIKKQEKVKQSAKKHIAMAAIAYAICLGTSLALLAKGHKSKFLQNISEMVITPGSKLFKKESKTAKFFDKYVSIDFADDNGKLALSRGQLTSCVLIGAFGYFGSAKDRGKQNFLEVLSRYPLVGFYVITGSELLEKGLKRFLKGKNNYTDLIIGKDNKVPKLTELPELAEQLAKKKNTSIESEFKNLLKGKSIITGVPFLFSMGVMGFMIAGITQFWTRQRFNAEQNKQQITNPTENNEHNVQNFLATKGNIFKKHQSADKK